MFKSILVPIDLADTDLAKPAIYWVPVIAPGNLTFYKGTMFPQWQGSALVGGLNADGYKLYAHQNEDIVRLTPAELKAKMAAKDRGAD